LEPGEVVQAVVAPVLQYNPKVPFVGAGKMIASDTRAIVATNRRIFVARVAKNLPTGRVKGIERSLPRSTRLGEPSGKIWKCESLGEPLWVFKQNFAEVRMVDSATASASASALPPPTGVGLVDRFKNARDVSTGRSTSLPLFAPTRLRIPIDPEEGPSLPIFVFDPALIRGDSDWPVALRILELADQVEAAPIADVQAIARPLRELVAADPYFGPALDSVTDGFVAAWTSMGQRLCDAEVTAGVLTTPKCIGSATSAALTLSSLRLESPQLVLLAQCLVRDCYAFSRMRRGAGPDEVNLTASEYPATDFRLMLFARPWNITMNSIEGWTSRFPLPSDMRDTWLNALASSAAAGRGVEEPFVDTVLEAMRMLSTVSSPPE
jgi:hypothetical protein